MKTCGSCTAGIVLMNEDENRRAEVQRCDECGLFETDADATAAVHRLLKLLHRTYKGRETSDTVADAFDRLERKAQR